MRKGWLVSLAILIPSLALAFGIAVVESKWSISFYLKNAEQQDVLVMRLPNDAPGALDLRVLDAHPQAPQEDFVRLYALRGQGLFAIDAKGTRHGPLVPSPSLVHARVSLDAAPTIPPGGEQLIRWTKDYDTGQFFDAAKPTRLTFHEQGKYHVVCGATYTEQPSGMAELYLRRSDGATLAREPKELSPQRDTRLLRSIERHFNAGEGLDVLTSQTSPNAIPLSAGSGTFCAVHKIG